MIQAVKFGVDRLVTEPHLLGGVNRVGLITNDAARLATDVTQRSRVALRNAGLPLVRLFGPEHGLSGVAADGAAVRDDIDVLTGLPVLSLYGERMRPAPESLHDLDALLFDIPDVGARFYTFTWTLFHALAASADVGVPLIILDRPNPLGGDLSLAEGPLLDLTYRSFLGEDPIPIRHQLTLGELARLWQRDRFPRAKLQVIACEGWQRSMSWPETGLPWVPTSPSMPSIDSVALYPGLCLFEATNLSVGRGTGAPFQRLGAPWLNADALMRDAHSRGGIELVRDDFTPSLAPYNDEHCAGVRVYDTNQLGPVAVGLLLLASAVATQGPHFAWSTYPTAANPGGHAHFERLLGRSGIRELLDVDADSVTVESAREWTITNGWRDRVADGDVLLY